MESPACAQLKLDAAALQGVHLRDLLKDGERNAALCVEAEGIVFDFARQKVTTETVAHLLQLARAADLEAKRDSMFAGDKINLTEDRAVYHVALRAPKGSAPMVVDGVDQVPLVHDVLDRVNDFSARVRSGEWRGATGKVLKTVVAIGIGGSYLGPEFLFEALKADPKCAAAAKGRTLKFVANVDPVDFARQTADLDASETLVIVVSKSFTTAETMMNAATIKTWLLANIPDATEADVVRQHVAAVSTKLELTSLFGIDAANVFGFWDYVGGRFSVHSAVGMLPLALQYGFEPMRQFLAGAHAMDLHFKTAPLEKNLPVLLGLMGLYNSTFLGFECKAILPYAQALLRFAAHVQQLDMESNGKSVKMDGTPLTHAAGEVIFGEPGTNGQHSFYQLMHQGRTVPAEFIGFAKSQAPQHVKGLPISNHDELMSNFFAQPDALACGTADAPGHKAFAGDRPSLSLLFEDVSPFSMGQLLALYEHRVCVQGWVWGINSFDQWGVQLGKVLAGQVSVQLAASRNAGAPVAPTFNSSTAALLEKYLAKSA
ncbi:Phosphoglucose isomerase [Pelagophyceae sp. CCMP2097]|nr:Phosphoglucose isomerase [Pelagophyceae sp. CCMP2097]|mmetsp:Transcript_25820/g.86783  ORF Transcript_25820/g.86783 Transcript_25820/m.86783 type:complete len:544 (-) Transcript_25820:81-1712(-)